jgi:guanylate kinase
MDMSEARQEVLIREAPESALPVVAETDVPELVRYVLRPRPPLVMVLSGPSGVGKDVTLERIRELGYPFYYTVTYTTRPKRPGEIHGVHYNFVTLAQFEELLARDQFLEHAEVYGHCYGVPRREVHEALAAGQDVIIKADVQGARTLKNKVPDAIFLFLAPPSMQEQAERLRRRKTEDAAALGARLRIAQEEMRAMPMFDYVVVNRTGRLQETVSEILAIFTAEKCRVHPRQILL